MRMPTTGRTKVEVATSRTTWVTQSTVGMSSLQKSKSKSCKQFVLLSSLSAFVAVLHAFASLVVTQQSLVFSVATTNVAKKSRRRSIVHTLPWFRESPWPRICRLRPWWWCRTMVRDYHKTSRFSRRLFQWVSLPQLCSLWEVSLSIPGEDHKAPKALLLRDPFLRRISNMMTRALTPMSVKRTTFWAIFSDKFAGV